MNMYFTRHWRILAHCPSLRRQMEILFESNNEIKFDDIVLNELLAEVEAF